MIDTSEQEKVTVWRILPDFGSYINDMETNLKMDELSWEGYENDATPFIADLLLDYGNWDWVDIEEGDPDYYGKLRALAEEAAMRWLGKLPR